MSSISVLLVDDNPVFLRIAVRFLRQRSDVVIAGTANGGEEALAQVEAVQPQIVLLDLAMPDLPGLKVIPLLRARLPDVGIIALTLLDANGYRQPALAAGADAFVSKATMDTDLLPAIQQVAQQRADGEGSRVDSAQDSPEEGKGL